jgi:hypothetical protein
MAARHFMAAGSGRHLPPHAPCPTSLSGPIRPGPCRCRRPRACPLIPYRAPLPGQPEAPLAPARRAARLAHERRRSGCSRAHPRVPGQSQHTGRGPISAPGRTGPDSDAMKDLERLFKIRDQELSKGGDGGPAVGYESTQPSPVTVVSGSASIGRSGPASKAPGAGVRLAPMSPPCLHRGTRRRTRPLLPARLALCRDAADRHAGPDDRGLQRHVRDRRGAVRGAG